MQEVNFPRSASHQPQNLQQWRPETEINCLATCHKDSVQILSLDEEWQVTQTKQVCLTDKTCSIIQARVVQIDYQSILILITEKNIQFHDIRRDSVIYTFVPNEATIAGESAENFACGICHMGGFIFIGLAIGAILALNRMPDGCIIFEEVITSSRTCAITDLATDDTSIVSGDADGGIILWEPDGERILRIEQQFESVSNQFPITNIIIEKEMIVAAYGSGHVRVYGVLQGRLLSEVHAHNGWINDMAIESHSTSDRERNEFLIATACDDSRIRVFIVRTDFPWISHKCDHSIRNQQVVGVKFQENGFKLAAVAYDSSKLYLLPCR